MDFKGMREQIKAMYRTETPAEAQYDNYIEIEIATARGILTAKENRECHELNEILYILTA